MLFVLFQVPSLSLNGRVVDDEIAAEDNLNRYVLLDGPEILRAGYLQALSTERIGLHGIEGRIEGLESFKGLE